MKAYRFAMAADCTSDSGITRAKDGSGQLGGNDLDLFDRLSAAIPCTNSSLAAGTHARGSRVGFMERLQ